MDNIFFYKGKDNIFEKSKTQNTENDADSNKKKMQEEFLKVLDNKNLSFLLGSGCSSHIIEKSKNDTDEKEYIQVGIPVMCPLATDFYALDSFSKYKRWLKLYFKIDVGSEDFKTNLETFLSTLHSVSFYYSKSKKNDNSIRTEKRINTIIQNTRNFLLSKILNEDNITNNADEPLLNIYKQFYRKLLSRNSTLPRLNIFTTNYDLYSERAMDLLGIHYANGFTGGISKFFNPTIFNYALAEKMDLSQSKWSVIDNFFYLYKIHGSVNWIEAEGENKLFKVKEIQEPKFENLQDKEIMIYPTPLKYNASFGSPYSDLFREFQRKLMINNNILVTIGYSFNDEHINNLIFQAFTIPSFRLIVIGEPTANNKIGELQELDDSRIWIIGEKFPANNEHYVPLYFFKRFVEEILPDLTNEDLDKKMETTINNLKNLLK
ncbi:SIR2 family protein [Bacteroidia bacterium]|nr:SIR2 family protein [Bacteroidia bacterium]